MNRSARPPGTAPRSRGLTARLAFVVFVAAAGLLLVLEHRAHVLQAWPLLFLAACIAAHFLLHRGNGDGAGHGR